MLINASVQRKPEADTYDTYSSGTTLFRRICERQPASDDVKKYSGTIRNHPHVRICSIQYVIPIPTPYPTNQILRKQS